jgi:uncharacterized SAM-binding protein YcdF (DUF218 family)
VSSTLERAAELWSFLSALRSREPADAVVVCCSYDIRVCDYACDLLKQNLAPRLVLSGNTGNWTKLLWDEPEAHVFRRRALAQGIEAERIHVEDRSTNFGENIAFVRELMPQLRRVIFVTKPNAILRVALTVPVQWPEVTAWVDSPPFEFPEEVSNIIGVFGLIHEMVGDVDRVLQYPSRGFQIPYVVPENILESWKALVVEGFSHHLLTPP